MAIDDLTKNMTESQIIKTNVIALNTRVSDMESDVKKHHELLILGNGDKPIPERVRNLEKLALKVERISSAVLVQTIAFVFTILGMALAFFFKVYPILDKLANQP